MSKETFKKDAHQIVDWMAEYFEGAENYPVRPNVKPGEIKAKIRISPPSIAEGIEEIMKDFEEKIMPGMTHWHSPNFFAYFPANKSEPSVLAEMLTSALGAQCMSWITSPAAAELEESMMEWLREMLDLPQNFTGVIQDTASTATLGALLTAREKASNFQVNEKGLGHYKFTVYSSTQAHSSIEKAVRIAGIGSENLRKIAVDENFAMIPEQLEKSINEDIKNGFTPLFIVSALGTTSSTAIDPIDAIGDVAQKYNIWHHVDAAYAGTALVLPEMRWMSKGLEKADSFVFNPHKWMFTNFDCSAYFVKDTAALINTFSMTPEYLRTAEDEQVNNYRDWGVQLGRRFRALKLWFVIRNFGVSGIQEKIRAHIALGQWLKEEVENHSSFELLAPVPVNLVCFRFKPNEVNNLDMLNKMNEELVHQLNDSGKLFLTHTKLNGIYTIRMVMGNTDVEKRHVEAAWQLIKKFSNDLK